MPTLVSLEIPCLYEYSTTKCDDWNGYKVSIKRRGHHFYKTFPLSAYNADAYRNVRALSDALAYWLQAQQTINQSTENNLE